MNGTGGGDRVGLEVHVELAAGDRARAARGHDLVGPEAAAGGQDRQLGAVRLPLGGVGLGGERLLELLLVVGQEALARALDRVAGEDADPRVPGTNPPGTSVMPGATSVLAAWAVAASTGSEGT